MIRYRCPRCGQSVSVRVAPIAPPTCSCGLTDDGRPRLAPTRMTKEDK